jgi:hypothetical protein
MEVAKRYEMLKKKLRRQRDIFLAKVKTGYLNCLRL